MCTITIDATQISATPAGSLTFFTAGGTVTNCISQIDMIVTCAGATQSTLATVTGNTWQASVDVKCTCGSPITITATCNDSTPCSATYTTNLICQCCPTVSTAVNNGVWNNSGQQSLTYITTVTVPPGCVVTVRRDFGDGTFGAVQTFNTTNTYVETHPYTAGSYTSNLIILSSPCPASASSVATSSGGAPPCATSSFLAAVCKLLRFLFMFFGGAGGALLVASASGCVLLNGAILSNATTLLALAGVALILIFLFCRKCECGFPWKLIGQLVTIVGGVMFMFVLPSFCMQPVPFPGPAWALGAASFVILLGIYGLLYAGWYIPFRKNCPLTICDFWGAVKEALTVALFSASILVYPPLLANGMMTTTNLGFALLAITIGLMQTNQQIQSNQIAGKC